MSDTAVDWVADFLAPMMPEGTSDEDLIQMARVIVSIAREEDFRCD